jgi:5-methylcytosine-specific restriction endonuclease McrA
MRRPNTTRTGYSFSPAMVQAVWDKGRPIPGYDARAVRADACGAAMYRDHYGLTTSVYGWEVDHMCPVARGGSDDLWNLQPLQWRNNRHKGDAYPQWTCAV